MIRNKYNPVSFAGCVFAILLSTTTAHAQHTGVLEPVNIPFGGEDKALTFENASITATDSSAISIGSVEEDSSNNADIQLRSTVLKSGTNAAISIVTRGNVSFYSDTLSSFDNAFSILGAANITVDNRAAIGIDPEDWKYASPTGIVLESTQMIDFKNYNYVLSKVTGVRMHVEGGGSGLIKFYNSDFYEDQASGQWLGGEIRTTTTENGLTFSGRAGDSNRMEAVNDGYIGNYYDPGIPTRSAGSSLLRDAEPGSAVYIDSSMNGGYLINNGSIQSSTASIRNHGSNITIDLREGSGIAGAIEIAEDSNNTLILNSSHHRIMFGSMRDGTRGNVLMGNYGDDVSKYNTLKISLGHLADWENEVWEDSYGQLYAEGRVDINNVILLLDLDNAAFDVGNVFTIVRAEDGIAGSFYGLEATDMHDDEYGNHYWTVEFSEGDYEFLMTYIEVADGDNMYVNEITIEVLSMIPEPSAYAALFGAAALAFAAYRRRK